MATVGNSSQISTGSTTDAAIHFNTYRDYEDHVKSMPVASFCEQQSPHACPDYWLAEFPINEQKLRWFRLQAHAFDGDPPISSSGMTSCGDGLKRYTSTCSSRIFVDRLTADNVDITHRLLIVNKSRAVWGYLDLDYDEVAATIGLGLDMSPAIWDHLRDRLLGAKTSTIRDGTQRTSKWVENSPVLDIGESSMVFLDHGPIPLGTIINLIMCVI